MALLPLFHLPYAHIPRRGNSADAKIKRMAGRMAEMRANRLWGWGWGGFSLSLILCFLRNRKTHMTGLGFVVCFVCEKFGEPKIREATWCDSTSVYGSIIVLQTILTLLWVFMFWFFFFTIVQHILHIVQFWNSQFIAYLMWNWTIFCRHCPEKYEFSNIRKSALSSTWQQCLSLSTGSDGFWSGYRPPWMVQMSQPFLLDSSKWDGQIMAL